MELSYFDEPCLGYWLDGRKPKVITRFCNDTRKLLPNDCFVAIKTAHVDGHDFIEDAQHKGASCALVQYPHTGLMIPQFVCKYNTIETLKILAKVARSHYTGSVIGITGSMGKTTTKDILSLLLGVKHNKTFLNENNKLGLCMTLGKLCNSENNAVVEIGIDTIGSIEEKLHLVNPTDGIITGVCRIHLNGFISEENVANEKCKLAEFVLNNHGQCILSEDLLRFKCFQNIKDECVIPSDKSNSKVKYYVTYKEDVRKLNISIHDMNYSFLVPHKMSNGMTKNLVLAAVYSLLHGEEKERIEQRLNIWEPSFLRGSVEQIGNKTFYIDCYNANFVAFCDSLANFDRLFPNNGRLFIIGSLKNEEIGNDSYEININLGATLPIRSKDTIVLIGDQANAIETGILQKFSNVEYLCIKNPNNISDIINSFSGIVYIKGHHFYHLEKFVYK